MTKESAFLNASFLRAVIANNRKVSALGMVASHAKHFAPPNIRLANLVRHRMILNDQCWALELRVVRPLCCNQSNYD